MAWHRLSPLDAAFLYLDTGDTPMHVGGLMTFENPPGMDDEWLRGLYSHLRQQPVVAPWNRKLATPAVKLAPVHFWVDADDVDLEYHVRRSALPSPGDERELGIMVARLHSNPLDLSKPPWEMHVIEGLSGNRFALYIKVHHALVDGVSAARLLTQTLSTDPDDDATPIFFSYEPPKRPRASRETEQARSLVGSAVGTAFGAASAGARLGQAVGRNVLARIRPSDLVGTLDAPVSILNARVTRQRRFATQLFETERLKRIAKSSGTTLNDVVVTICGGGLRTYLQELGELPDRSLVGFLPVNLRTDDSIGGNAVAAMLATMGTDIADPAERLQAVHASTTSAKGQLRGMDQTTAIAYSAALLAPALLQAAAAVVGLPQPATTFNVCVSNVPGPKEHLYFRGARMQASYPLSIPTHGMALNITLTSYADVLAFGFIGCRDVLPHLQRLAVATGKALDDLEQATVG